MIQPNELRIGNWVNPKFPMIVASVGKDFIYADFEGNLGDLWEFNTKDNPAIPIPLTPEILEKAGFVQDIQKELLRLHDSYGSRVEWFYKKNYGLFFVLDSEYETEVIKPVQYLHQLQNLYFALTGIELSITL